MGKGRVECRTKLEASPAAPSTTTTAPRIGAPIYGASNQNIVIIICDNMLWLN